MNRLMLFGLVVCNSAILTVGNGTLPLLPVFANSRGASAGSGGLYIAFAYLCLAAGSVVGGRLSDVLKSRRNLLVLVGVVLAPLVALMGRSVDMWGLVATTGTVWLLAGITLATVGAIAARESSQADRGRTFGIIATSVGIGSLVGGLTAGPLVDRWGYPTMFADLAAVVLLIPISALLTVREEQQTRQTDRMSLSTAARVVSAPIVFLLSAQLLGWTANGTGNMVRSISMHDLQFSGTAITTTTAVGGLLSLPLPFLLGWLSDRLGRKWIITASYLSGTACLLVLSVSQTLWQFWVAAAFLSLLSVNQSVAPALVADVVPRERVGTGIALLQGFQWLGIIGGWVYSGFALQAFGLEMSLFIASSAGVLAAISILLIKRQPLPRTREST